MYKTLKESKNWSDVYIKSKLRVSQLHINHTSLISNNRNKETRRCVHHL
jgi:hypothetical protein